MLLPSISRLYPGPAVDIANSTGTSRPGGGSSELGSAAPVTATSSTPCRLTWLNTGTSGSGAAAVDVETVSRPSRLTWLTTSTSL